VSRERGGALSETVATVSLRTEKMLSMFRLRNKKCSETGPDQTDVVPGRNSTRNCSGSITTIKFCSVYVPKVMYINVRNSMYMTANTD